MLRSLRNKSQSIFFKIFLVLIILGFAAWGVGDLTGGTGNKPVFKTKKFEISYQQVLKDFDKARNSMSKPLNIEDAIKAGILNQVLMNHKIKILIDQEGMEKDLTVPREILKSNITQDKKFQNLNKNFSSKKFKNILNQNQISEEEYLLRLSTQILQSHILYPININESYSKNFADKFVKWENLLLDLEYFHIPYIKVKKLNAPDDIALKDYYKKNQSRYFQPKLRNVSFLQFTPKDFYEEITVSNEEIKNLYEDKKDEFIISEKRDYFQIIFKDKMKAENFYKKTKIENNFEKLAKNLNYKLNDIRLNGITKDQIPSKLSDYIFNSSENEIISPVKTNFGYHVIKINKIYPTKIIQLDEVKSSLINEIKYEKSTEKLYSKLDNINEMVYSGNTLKEIAFNINLIKKRKVQHLKNFTKKGDIYKNFELKNSKLSKIFVEEVWKSSVDEISELIETDQDHYTLIKVEKEIDKKDLTFEEAKPIVKRDFLQDEAKKITLKNAKQSVQKPDFEKNFIKYSGLKRFNNNLTNQIFTLDLIDKVFKTDEKNLNFLKTKSGILIVKINKKYFTNNIKTENYKLVERNFNKSFNSDLTNSLFEFLENKHDLKSNYKSLNNLINNN